MAPKSKIPTASTKPYHPQMQRESVPSRYAALFKKMEDDKKGAATREADTPQDNRITAPQASPSTSRNLETFLMSSSTLSAQQDPDTGAWSMLSEYGADETSPQIQPSLPLSRAFMQNPKTGAWPVEVQKHGAPADIATPTTFKNTSRDELKLTCNPSQAPDLFDNMDESQDYKTTASFADAEDISPPVPIDEDEDIAALSTNNAEFFSPVKLSSQTFNTPSTALNLVNRTTSSKPHLQAPPLASSSSTPTKVQRDDDDEPLIKIRLAERKAREEEKSPRSLVRKLEVLASDGRGEAFWNGDDGKAMPQPGGPTQREKKKATRSSASWGKASSKAKNNGTASLMSTTNRDTVAPQPTHVQDVSALKKGKQRLPVAPTTPSAASTSFEGVQGPSQHAIPEVQMPVIAVPDNGNVSPVPSQHPNAGQESKSSVAAMLTNDLAPPKAPPATVGQQADSTTTTNDPCEQYFSELLPRLHQLAQKAGRPVDASHITDKRSDTLLLQLKPLEGTIERPWILELGHGYFVEILSDIDKLAQDLGKPVKVLRVFQWGTKVPQLLVRAVGEGGAGWFFGGEEAAGGTFGTGATASKQAELETVFVKDECASRGPDWTITTISKQVKDKVASTKSPSTASCTSPDTEALASTNKTSHTSKSGLGGSFKTGLPMQDVSNACGKAKEQKPTPETAGKQPSSSPVQTPVSHSLLNIAKEKDPRPDQALQNSIKNFTGDLQILEMCLEHPSLSLADLQAALGYSFDRLMQAYAEHNRSRKIRDGHELRDASPPIPETQFVVSSGDIFTVSAKDCKRGVVAMVEARLQVDEDMTRMGAGHGEKKQTAGKEELKVATAKRGVEFCEDAWFLVLILVGLAVLYWVVHDT